MNAFFYYLQAAKKGHKESQYQVALCHQLGKGKK
jgi:TPR repeat protein